MISHGKNVANQNLKTQIIILTVTDKIPELEFLWISGLCYAQKIFSSGLLSRSLQASSLTSFKFQTVLWASIMGFF